MVDGTAVGTTRDPLIVEVVVALARRWQVVIAVPALASVVTLVLLLLTPDRYQAVTSFVPETRGRVGTPGMLAGLAAAAGITLSAGDPGQTPQFYADLLSSTPIVYGVLQSRFAALTPIGDGPSGDSVALVDYLQPGSDPLPARLERAAKSLGGVTRVDLDRQTGVVRLTVVATKPTLAAAIAREYVHQLTIFNRDSRQSQARSRRVFAETRVADAERTLGDAESTMRAFYERNRVATSPGLRFEEGRLQRQLQIRQELYISLSRELEQARISEADESPAFTVIEAALVPTSKSGPNRRGTLLGVALVVLGLTISWVLFYELQRDALQAGVASLRARVAPLLPLSFRRSKHR